MEDFYYAGGLRALQTRIADLLDLECLTVTGATLGAGFAGATVFLPEVIRPRDNPLQAEGGLAILHGSLAPDGAVIKASAATPELLRHNGPALVFDDYGSLEQAHRRGRRRHVRRDGPHLAKRRPGRCPWDAGMGDAPDTEAAPRAGRDRSGADLGCPNERNELRDLCSPCARQRRPLGGPIALVETGDPIDLDVQDRRIDLRVSEAELARRRARFAPKKSPYERGYGSCSSSTSPRRTSGVTSTFLGFGPRTPEPEIH